MKKWFFVGMLAFLYHSSFAHAMHYDSQSIKKLKTSHSNSNLPRCLVFSQMVITDAKFSEILQSNDSQNIKKLKISHSKIDPQLFKRLPSGLEELSLESVIDLDGNVVAMHHFLADVAYRNDLERLALKNQQIGDSEVVLIAQMQGLKNLNLSENQITGQGFSEITHMNELIY